MGREIGQPGARWEPVRGGGVRDLTSVHREQQLLDRGSMAHSSPMSEFTVVGLPGGSQLSLCQWGPAGGAPVILCHGTPGSRRFRHPDSWCRRLGLRVVVCRPARVWGMERGGGRSTVKSAAHVAAVADHIGDERFALVGLSGGAGHALGPRPVSSGTA